MNNVLMGISFLLVWKNKKCFPYCSPLTYFLIQLGFNLIWTTLFFVMKKPLLALLDICLIIYFAIQTYNRFIKIDRLAAYLLVPYLLWLLIAFSMNFYIVLMN
jgi:tryptophan-rich sensory protein